MKPAKFSYTRPETSAEALALLHDLGDETKIIAGGQSLMPLLNLRFARPSHLVDVNRLHEHDFIRLDDGQLTIGALTRHARLEHCPDMRGPWGAFADALPQVGHHPIRVRGTFGGSVSHADPTAELPLIAATLDASIVLESVRGRRAVPAAEFFQGPLMTALEADELTVEGRFPAPPAGAVSAFEEFSERAGDFATVSVCAAVAVDAGGVCTWARVGLGAVASVPVRATQTEALLVGAPLTPAVIREAADSASRECDPPSSHQASAQFRRELVAVLVARALARLTP